MQQLIGCTVEPVSRKTEHVLGASQQTLTSSIQAKQHHNNYITSKTVQSNWLAATQGMSFCDNGDLRKRWNNAPSDCGARQIAPFSAQPSQAQFNFAKKREGKPCSNIVATNQ